MDRQNLRTDGKRKAIQTESHKVHCLNFGMIRCLFRSSQMQVHQVDCGDLICCSRGCWERFPFLFFVRTAPCVQLWALALPLHVGHLRVSVLRSDRTGLKERLIRGLWLTQAGGREVGVWMRGEPVAAEAGVTLQQPEAPCVLPGKLSLDRGTLAVAGCTGSREGAVESDLCSHTGFLVATAAALASPVRLWGPRW